jgi:hypothetical protein
MKCSESRGAERRIDRSRDGMPKRSVRTLLAFAGELSSYTNKPPSREPSRATNFSCLPLSSSQAFALWIPVIGNHSRRSPRKAFCLWIIEHFEEVSEIARRVHPKKVKPHNYSALAFTGCRGCIGFDYFNSHFDLQSDAIIGLSRGL